MSFLSEAKNRLAENTVSVRTEGKEKTCVIDGRLYIDTGKDDIFRAVPRGMDDARDMKAYPVPQYVVRNGTAYEIVDGRAYMDQQYENGAKTVTAKKSGNITALDPEDGKFTTYTSNGHVEAEEMVQQGYHVVAKADENGQPLLDEYGHMNVWQIEDAKLRKRYADIPEKVEAGMSFVPAGEPQDFVQVGKNIAVMCPWGKNGRNIPQTVDAGGYLTSVSDDDCYGIGQAEFEETYKTLEDKTLCVMKNVPDKRIHKNPKMSNYLSVAVPYPKSATGYGSIALPVQNVIPNNDGTVNVRLGEPDVQRKMSAALPVGDDGERRYEVVAITNKDIMSFESDAAGNSEQMKAERRGREADDIVPETLTDDTQMTV